MIPPQAPCSTVLDILRRACRLQPDNCITFLNNANEKDPKSITYANLLREAKANASILRKGAVVVPNQIVALYFDNHKDNVIWFWSVIAAGAIPAVLQPFSNNLKIMGDQLANIDRILQSPTVITSQHLALHFKPMPSLKTITMQRIHHHEFPQKMMIEAQCVQRNELAAIYFTSGSTGHSKAVEFTHKQIIASVEAKTRFHEVQSNWNFLGWCSFDHTANFAEVHLQAMYNGCDQFQVATAFMVAEPACFLDLVNKHRISYTFAPNFFMAAAINPLSKPGKELPPYDLSCLKVLFCGGEASSTETLVTADEVLVKLGAPMHSIKSVYGLSETLAACFYCTKTPSYDVEHGYKFSSVGQYLDQAVEVRIMDVQGKECPRNVQGAVQLRGDLVFQRYHNDEAATLFAMTADGWFDTGDLGVIDNNGIMRVNGRSKETMIINSNNISTFELEHAIETANIQGVTPSFTASFSTWVEGHDTESIVILFHPTEEISHNPSCLRRVIQEINHAVIGFCAQPPYAVIPLPKQKLPKSALGKLSRGKLKAAYEDGQFDEFLVKDNEESEDSAEAGIPLTSTLQETIAEALACHTSMPRDQVKADTPFQRMKIDSLGYLRIKRLLEKWLDMEGAIPMPMLIRSSNILELETALLGIGTVPATYDPIVPLAKGSKTPLILCPPGGGEFLTWLPVIKYLEDRPIYALRVRGLQKNEKLFDSLDDMVDCYIEGIKRYQPEGPYALMGFCFGGTLSFEIAKKLEAAGDEVAFCAGIDNPPLLNSILWRRTTRQFFIDLLHFHAILTEEEAMAMEKDMSDVPDDDFVDEVFRRFPDGTLEALGLTKPNVEQWARVNEGTRIISEDYRPEGTVSKYDLFWVPPAPIFRCTLDQWYHEFLGAWKNHVTEPVREHRVAGSHFTIMHGENIDALQKALNKALTDRGL